MPHSARVLLTRVSTNSHLTVEGVFPAVDTKTGQEVAVKLEHIWNALLSGHCDLEHEYSTYRDISKHVPNAHTIPSIRWYGEEGNYCALVMDMLSPTLQDLFSSHSGPFSLKTVLMIADQLISHVEFLHGQLYIHRGIKPDNFCIGLQDQRKIFMIDLGFAKRYMDPKRKQHMPYMEFRERCANPNWCSLNVSKGTMPSRRDDLESLGYMFVVRVSFILTCLS